VNSNLATQPAAPLPPCPGWCDPQLCERTESDVNHTSRQVVWEGCDARVTLTLVRADEFGFAHEWGGDPELALSVESKTVQCEPVTVYLGVDELPGLIGELIEQLAAQLASRCGR
jgi:hypothetical protein